MHATDAAELQQASEGIEAGAVMLRDLEPSDRLQFIASINGDISAHLTEQQLATIGAECIEDYEEDCRDRSDWEDTVKKAFKAAAQEPKPEKTFPWRGASNVSFPLLTTAAIQFAARAYPAIVKGDEAVNCKVVGKDEGRPAIGPDGQMQPQMGPDGQPMISPDGKPMPVWDVEPGAKASRANRVRDYMNTVLFYRMEGWEADTDALLLQLPIAGCVFRKLWVNAEGEQRSSLLPALKLVVPMTAKCCKTAPRLTEVREDVSYNDILGKQRRGFYRTVTLGAKDDDDDRKILEQHCRIDLDDDDYAEPYIVTLDHATGTVLRIEPDFTAETVEVNQDGEVVDIDRGTYFIKYDFLPAMDGKFYATGLGHLLEQIGDVVNRSINQMIDAGAAQVAGGGFIGSGVNLQGAGKRSASLRFAPGEYKTVNVSGNELRSNIYERTFPGPSPIMYQVLDMMLGAAKDISSVKDVLTGEGSNNGQVGTTLALIEQGLQVFTAIYKRIYRSLKDEFSLLFENIGEYGGQAAAEDYAKVLDDPAADFAKDFASDDLDIRPVSDPTSVTRMQNMARAQFLMTFISAPGVNPQAIYKRAWEAASVDDIDELLMPPAPPPQPSPVDMAKAGKDQASANLDMERAETEKQDREIKRLETLAKMFAQGHQIGMGA
jgi:chaperonin GroES